MLIGMLSTAELYMISPAPAADSHFRHTAITIGSFAAASVICSPVSEVSSMNFQNEMMYQATMSFARKMLRDGLITEDEYRQIDTMFREKYQPKIGTLFVDLTVEQR